MRVIFMGTPDFSVGTLEALVNNGHEVVGVITQPDKQKGRGKEVVMSPVKEKAIELNIPVYQPVKVREAEEVEKLRTMQADVIVVVAFGQLLSQEILDMPRFGCINVHASLLPEYRGAAPIQRAVIDGRDKSGVTTMQMNAGLDTGDMIMQTEVILDEKETGGSLFDKLSKAGAELLVKTLEAIENGTATRTKQDDSKSNYAAKLDKASGEIKFSDSAVMIERLTRGLNPWPSAYTHIDGKTLKIWDADVCSDNFSGEPGSIVYIGKDSFVIKCGEGALVVNELQLEGKKRMTVDAFLRGYHLNEGTILK